MEAGLETCPDSWIPQAFAFYEPSAAEDFDPNADWSSRYYILNNESVTSEKVGTPMGVLNLDRTRGTGNEIHLAVDYTATKQYWKSSHVMQASIRFNTDQLGTPVSWRLNSEIRDSHGKAFAETRIREEAIVHKGLIVTTTNKKKKQIAAPERFTTDFSFFDAVQRMRSGRELTDASTFDLFESFTLRRSDQRLYGAEPLELEVKGHKLKLHGYCRIGPGCLPWHYWLNEQDRLVLATGNLRAYIFNPAATLDNCDTSWVFHEVRA